MPILTLLVVLCVLGLAAYLAQRAPFIAEPVKTIIVWLIVAVALYLVLSATGVIDMLRSVKTPHV